ncbi:MAG TPA: hypothetical protein DDZ88_22295 [Verrucomicrobiales bacterium]|nr:hypothetical protein [Verrucomicrobiales bacterium]
MGLPSSPKPRTPPNLEKKTLSGSLWHWLVIQFHNPKNHIMNRPRTFFPRPLSAPPTLLILALGALLAALPGAALAEAFSGNLLLVAKGEVEVYHNGRKIVLRDKADDQQHFRVKVPERSFNAGDVIVLRVHSPYVYRAISAAVNLAKKGGQIPIKKENWRFLGPNTDPRKITAATLQASQVVPASATPDGNGEAEREKLGFLTGSDWVKTADNLKSSYCIGFLITQEMLNARQAVK